MTISIIIPVYNAQKTLVRCLNAIYKSKYNDYEVVIVDDDSTDSSRSIARGYKCRMIKLKKRYGAATARNVGVKNSKGEILVFVDSDMTFAVDFLQSLISPLSPPQH